MLPRGIPSAGWIMEENNSGRTYGVSTKDWHKNHPLKCDLPHLHFMSLFSHTWTPTHARQYHIFRLWYILAWFCARTQRTLVWELIGHREKNRKFLRDFLYTRTCLVIDSKIDCNILEYRYNIVHSIYFPAGSFSGRRRWQLDCRSLYCFLSIEWEIDRNSLENRAQLDGPFLTQITF